MPHRQPQALALRVLSHQRQAVGAGGAEAGPGADAVELCQPGHVVDGALEHLRQHPALHLRVDGAELARGADEQLPGGTRLDIARHRWAAGVVSTGDVTQFDQGVSDGGGVAIGDQQVALLRLDRQFRAQFDGLDTVGEDHRPGPQPAPVI